MAYINGLYVATVVMSFKVSETDTEMTYGDIKQNMSLYTSELKRLIEEGCDYGKYGSIDVDEQRAQVWRTDT